MARGLTLAASIASRGILVDPLGGSGRASRGYVTAGESADSVVLDPLPLISSQLLSTKVLGVQFVEVYRSPFWHPDREYTGFAASGYWYTDGVRDLSHNPQRATWATEAVAPAADRSDQDSFPRRILVVLTVVEVAIFDADSLELWLRFRLSRNAPPALGPFLGTPTTEPRSMSFCNGFLVVATNAGLRIANFRRDFAYTYTSTTSYRSTLTGLKDRNTATYMDGAAVGPTLASNDCLRVSAESLSNPSGVNKRGYTVCAVSHAVGFSGITLDKPGISNPQVKNQTISRNFTSAWSVYDDADADSTSPIFIDAGSNWEGFEVSEGDTLTTDLPSTHTVVAVDQIVPGSRLILSPELPLTASGSNYTVSRKCSVVKAQADGSLYLGNGDNKVTHIDGDIWYDGVSPVFTNLSTAYPTAKLNAVVERMNDIAVTASGEFYVATTLGVFHGDQQVLDDGGRVVFTYSSAEVTEVAALYKILVGVGRDCPAVGVDPETGNVIVSLNEPEGDWVKKSVVTEINPNIHQAFRHFDRVGIVRSIATYRNPQGPPDKVP